MSGAFRLPAWAWLVASGLSAAVSLVSAALYALLYWPHRGKFDVQGRYFDAASHVVHHEQSRMLLWPALGFLLVAALLLMAWRNRALCRMEP